jgi:predicted DsbA family dithiol-disulfide isomerase
MQFFFDYECPFCKKGYEYLSELAGSRPGLDIEMRPIESHPLPEDHPPHTHLACQSYYAAKELGADMAAFNRAMFQAVALERRNVEEAEVICGIAKGIVDGEKLRAILDAGKYAAQIDENNDLAYEKSGVWFVPAFRAGGKKLDAKGGAGVTRDEVREFLDSL